MFCPSCGAEFRPSFVECNDCLVPLIDQPPESPVNEPTKRILQVPGAGLARQGVHRGFTALLEAVEERVRLAMRAEATHIQASEVSAQGDKTVDGFMGEYEKFDTLYASVDVKKGWRRGIHLHFLWKIGKPTELVLSATPTSELVEKAVWAVAGPLMVLGALLGLAVWLVVPMDGGAVPFLLVGAAVGFGGAMLILRAFDSLLRLGGPQRWFDENTPLVLDVAVQVIKVTALSVFRKLEVSG